MSRKIIFIGGIGTKTQFGGELTKNKEIIKRLKELGYNIVDIDTFGANHSKFKLFKVASQIMTCVLCYPKIPIIFSSAFNNIYPILKLFYRLGFKRKIIYWVIGGMFGERVCKNEFDNSILRMIHTFLVEGRLMQTQLKKAGFDNSIYVPNFKTIHKVHHRKINTDTICRFVFLSRIMPQKGSDDIFDSAMKLNDLGYENRYIIDFYGTIDREYEIRFHDLLQTHNGINYNGKLDLNNEDNYQILAEYDYMLFPTHWKGEGFPGVVIDAYKSSLPIIGSDWNFNSEFIEDQHTGIIIKTQDIDELTTAMRKAIDGIYNQQTLSNNASKQATIYDTRNVISNELMTKILNDLND